MIGLVVVTHGKLGSELINTAEFIVGRMENAVPVSIDGQGSPKSMRDEIADAIKKTDQGQGVLVLTDMFGGTPSNLSLTFLASNKVEVISGVNLPMILKVVQGRNEMSLYDLTQGVGSSGRKSIKIAEDILKRA